MGARVSATAGHVPPGLIPFLASPNTDIIQHRLNWTLRFPLPGPAPNDPNQLHQTFSQTHAMVTNPRRKTL